MGPRSSRASIAGTLLGCLLAGSPAHAYPPAVGILAKNRSCVSCHVANGPWADEARTVIDVLDARPGGRSVVTTVLSASGCHAARAGPCSP